MIQLPFDIFLEVGQLAQCDRVGMSSHPLVHSPNQLQWLLAGDKVGGLELIPGLCHRLEESYNLSFYSIRKLQSGVEQGITPKHFDTGSEYLNCVQMSSPYIFNNIYFPLSPIKNVPMLHVLSYLKLQIPSNFQSKSKLTEVAVHFSKQMSCIISYNKYSHLPL